jgi:hypothetical protein
VSCGCGSLFNFFPFISIRQFGNGQEPEFAEHFLLEYWRKSLAKWVRYKDIKGEEVCDMCVLCSSLSILFFLFCQPASIV